MIGEQEEEIMAFEVFRWGFVAAMVLTWLALAVGALMLLIPSAADRRPAGRRDVEQRAA